MKNLLSYELENFTFKVLYCASLYEKKIYYPFTAPCEKYKMVSLNSSIMKNIVVFALNLDPDFL